MHRIFLFVCGAWHPGMPRSPPLERTGPLAQEDTHAIISTGLKGGDPFTRARTVAYREIKRTDSFASLPRRARASRRELEGLSHFSGILRIPYVDCEHAIYNLSARCAHSLWFTISHFSSLGPSRPPVPCLISNCGRDAELKQILDSFFKDELSDRELL